VKCPDSGVPIGDGKGEDRGRREIPTRRRRNSDEREREALQLSAVITLNRQWDKREKGKFFSG